MFEEVKEMIDSTIYENGRGEVTAKNMNLAIHGVIDATENAIKEVDGSVKAVDTKIDALAKVVEENADSAVGLTFQFPILVLEMLYEGSPITDIFFDRETADALIMEFPTLAEPIEKIFENNSKAYEKFNAAIDDGKGTPIVSIDMGVLSSEIYAMEGVAFTLSYTLYPLATLMYHGLPHVMMMTNMEGASVVFSATADGSMGFVEAEVPAYIDVPKPGEVVDNGVEASNLALSPYSPFHSYSYPNENGDFYQNIFPNHIYTIGNYIFMRFTIGAEEIEAYIHKETGVTKSRVIATSVPVEVGIIPDGTLSCNYSSVLASGVTVTFTVKANVPWKVVEGENVIAEGEGGDMSTHSSKITYTIEANTSAEVLNHNYRLVATADGEELATLWIEQAAATTTVEETITEE